MLGMQTIIMMRERDAARTQAQRAAGVTAVLCQRIAVAQELMAAFRAQAAQLPKGDTTAFAITTMIDSFEKALCAPINMPGVDGPAGIIVPGDNGYTRR